MPHILQHHCATNISLSTDITYPNNFRMTRVAHLHHIKVLRFVRCEHLPTRNSIVGCHCVNNLFNRIIYSIGGPFDKSYLIEKELFKIVMYEIELFQIDPFRNWPFGKVNWIFEPYNKIKKMIKLMYMLILCNQINIQK